MTSCREHDQLREENSELQARASLEEIERLTAALNSQTDNAKRFWRLRCEQIQTHDELMEEKESEIALLHAQLAAQGRRKQFMSGTATVAIYVTYT